MGVPLYLFPHHPSIAWLLHDCVLLRNQAAARATTNMSPLVWQQSLPSAPDSIHPVRQYCTAPGTGARRQSHSLVLVLLAPPLIAHCIKPHCALISCSLLLFASSSKHPGTLQVYCTHIAAVNLSISHVWCQVSYIQPARVKPTHSCCAIPLYYNSLYAIPAYAASCATRFITHTAGQSPAVPSPTCQPVGECGGMRVHTRRDPHPCRTDQALAALPHGPISCAASTRAAACGPQQPPTAPSPPAPTPHPPAAAPVAAPRSPV